LERLERLEPQGFLLCPSAFSGALLGSFERSGVFADGVIDVTCSSGTEAGPDELAPSRSVNVLDSPDRTVPVAASCEVNPVASL
jgi:hypothetical protein